MTCIAAGLTFAYNGREVLSNISLTAESGSLVCVVGPNGSGKSTLLRCLAGDIVPHAGSVTYEGRRASSLDPGELSSYRSFLGQSDRADVPFPVATVVGFGTFASEASPDRRESAVSKAMEATEITHIATRLASTLSGGERRRMGVARTLSQDAPLLLMDEPTDSLDLGHADLVMRVARDYAVGNRSAVVSTHDLNLAAHYASTVVVLSGGRVAAVGTPTEVLTKGLLSTVYECAVQVMAHPEDGRPLIFL